ncbi:MAG: single-stranded DNA-binding protein [Bacilli bacterium]|jgi:single-strand DNA-binding protein|nr:single-stranded DNA-binding protein [Bacilli bacterium]
MHNLVYLIGRLCEDPVTKEYEDGKSMLTINLAVQRSFKNENGIYETDFIRCILWNGIAAHTSEYCKKGDLVGVKGRIQNRSYDDSGEKKYITEVIVDKVSFLASKKDTVSEETE